MKLLLGLILAVIAHGALAQSAELQVTINGEQQHVNDDEVIAALTAMIESSTVDTTKWVGSAERWEEALAEPSFIHALFDQPRPMKVWKQSDTTEASPAWVREIVIGFPGAGQILLKTSDGIRSVAKYSPCALERVIAVAKLDTVTKVQYLRDYCGR